MTKRVVIQLRVSEGDKAAIVVAAGAAGLGVSEWVRRVCLRACGEGLPVQSVDDYRASLEAGRPVLSFGKRSFKPDFK